MPTPAPIWPGCCRSSSAGTARPARRTCRPRVFTTPLRAATRLTLSQHCSPTPGQPANEPFVIPVALGLLGADGTALPLQLAQWEQPRPGSHTLVLTQASRDFHVFEPGCRARAVPPARVQCPGGAGFRLHRQPAADPAGARHRPLQPLGSRPAPGAQARHQGSSRATPIPLKRRCWTRPASTPCVACCATRRLDAAFKELVLTLPSETYIAEQLDVVDPQRIHAVREAMRDAVGPGAAA